MNDDRPRRSLMLAGGGMKVAFQAGVLQVWLDEAAIEFDHADGCSGGAFNLAMLCQGESGMAIADAWRTTHPRDGVSLRLADLARFPFGRSLTSLEKYRKYVFRSWRLDPERIRETTLTATFNAWDITRQRLRVFSAREFSFDVLSACVSLPVWFPPVRIGRNLYTDAVFATDANIDAALAAGAEEIWIIWTVSHRPEWLPGTITQFFHALEIAANSHLQQALERIRENNAIFDRDGTSPLGRCVTVRCLDAEVPLQYLVVLGPDRLHRAVELGVAAARVWCDKQGIPRTHTPRRSRVRYEDGVSLRFQDRMAGLFTPVDDAAARQRGIIVKASWDLIFDDAGLFATDPTHPARLHGSVHSTLFVGCWAEVVGGEAHILVADDGDPTRKQMRYRVLLKDETGSAFTLTGVKHVDSGRFRELWRETTTMDCRVYDGHVEDPRDTSGHGLLATGFLKLGLGDVIRQVLTVDVDGPRPSVRVRGVVRFAGAFVGNLWDVYARRISAYSPF